MLWALASAGCARNAAEPPDAPAGAPALAPGCRAVELAADQAIARRVDDQLVDPWGLARGTDGLLIANQETGTLAVLDDRGLPVNDGLAIDDGITGVAATHGEAFRLAADGTAYSARFIVASLQGQLIAVVPEVIPPIVATVVDRHGAATYTGVAVAGSQILATDFAHARIDVFDANFAREVLSPSADAERFRDPGLPAGYAPFNIAVVDQRVFVTYAMQRDGLDISGEGLGIVSEFDTAGVFARRLATGGVLDAPWGMAIAPAGFCHLAKPMLLVGNHGSGQIVPIDLDTLRPLGPLSDPHGEPIAIDGLWGLVFGDGRAGSANELYFTAGFDREEHGLFGRVETMQ